MNAAHELLAKLDIDSWYLRFHDLMPFRVREILLVSSGYDAFILEEDGRLSERLFVQFSELNLSLAPRLLHARNKNKAFELLEKRRIDMVVAMARLGDTNVNEFAHEVRAQYPELPITVMAFNESDLIQLAGGIDREVVDQTFVWTGDAHILLAATKLIEDRKNIEHDIQLADVQSILMVEDSVRRYSSFLPILYSEVMSQSQSLISEGFNDLHKLYRMRARPKIILANNYEEAWLLYVKYRNNIIGVISDVSFPYNGQIDNGAGFKLTDKIRTLDPDKAILLQSAQPENLAKAKEKQVLFVDKNSASLHRNIRNFLQESLGFGDFVFRLPDRKEVARASNVYEMKKLLDAVPKETLVYHSDRNHFSTWLFARSMFELARLLQPRKITEFDDVDEFIEFLVGIIDAAKRQEQQGMITDYSPNKTSKEDSFLRLGGGSIGGKARGLAFMHSLFGRKRLHERYENIRLQVPLTVAIGTDAFEHFMEQNNLFEKLDSFNDDHDIISCFIAGDFSERLTAQLYEVFQLFNGPLAVRSSSLLEDSQFQPFAGIYTTYMLPNNHADGQKRFQELCKAIKAVFASTYCKNARTYIDNTPHSIEDERMAVVIQQVVGQQYGDHYYPIVAGVAQTHNYYPIGHQQAKDGIAHVVLGLGQAVVSGGDVLRFSPKHPHILPQFIEAVDFLKYGQKHFLALDMQQGFVQDWSNPESVLKEYELSDAEADNTFHRVGSVYSVDDDAIRENLRLHGPRVVTFNNILKWDDIPLADTLYDLLSLIRSEFGCEAEIEFAVDYTVQEGPCLYLLQVRPWASQNLQETVNIEGFSPEEVLCCTNKSLGHGCFKHIQDVVFVKDEELDSFTTPKVAEEVAKINTRLESLKRPYLLIGPGRWGSSDPRLGIPVKWAQISGAAVIAETSMAGQYVEPSQGTHFFQNMISMGVGYLTLMDDLLQEAEDHICYHKQWLECLVADEESEHVKHISLNKPLLVYLDGRSGKAVVLKHDPDLQRDSECS